MILALAYFTSWAGVISSVAAVAAAVSAAVAVVMAVRNRNAVIQVHAIVNSRTTDLTNRVEQLSEALQKSGTKIPKSPKPTPPN